MIRIALFALSFALCAGDASALSIRLASLEEVTASAATIVHATVLNVLEVLDGDPGNDDAIATMFPFATGTGAARFQR